MAVGLFLEWTKCCRINSTHRNPALAAAKRTIVRLLAQPVIGIFCKKSSACIVWSPGDIAVYNGPGDDGAAVQERGLVPGHDSRGAQVSLTARQATADV